MENELQANESEAVWVTEKIQTNVSKYPFYGVWMPGSFVDHREKNNKELKSKVKIERERL